MSIVKITLQDGTELELQAKVTGQDGSYDVVWSNAMVDGNYIILLKDGELKVYDLTGHKAEVIA